MNRLAPTVVLLMESFVAVEIFHQLLQKVDVTQLETKMQNCFARVSILFLQESVIIVIVGVFFEKSKHALKIAFIFHLFRVLPKQ